LLDQEALCSWNKPGGSGKPVKAKKLCVARTNQETVKLVKQGGSVKTVKARRLCVASNVLFDKHLLFWFYY
jgi:hypothetical protein